MWIYYYCTFGLGHQSFDYDFVYFHGEWTMSEVKECLLDDKFYLKDDPCITCWEVERPPENHKNSEIKDTEAKIKTLKTYLKVLKSKDSFCSSEADGEDPTLQRNLKFKVVTDLLKRLHKAGFMYCAADINAWEYGGKCLTEPQRSKILRIIRKTKNY